MRVLLLLAGLIALPPHAAAGPLGSGPFASRCDPEQPNSDNCLDCSLMTSSPEIEAAWRKPETAEGCRFSHISIRPNASGSYDLIGHRTEDGKEETLRLEKTLQEVRANFKSDPALAQKALEDEKSELFERAQYAEWVGKVKVLKVEQSMKPLSAASMIDVATVTISYELRGLPAERIFGAFDRVNLDNGNTLVGRTIKPLMDWAIGEEGVAAQRASACLLRKAKNELAAQALSGKGKGKNAPAIPFFCLDEKKRACGDCFHNPNNNLRDLAYQVVQPENGTLRAIENGLIFIYEANRGKAMERPPAKDCN